MASRLLDRLTKVRARRRSGKVYRITRVPAPGDDSFDSKPSRFVAMGGGAGWRRKAELAAAEADLQARAEKSRAYRPNPEAVSVKRDDASSRPEATDAGGSDVRAE